MALTAAGVINLARKFMPMHVLELQGGGPSEAAKQIKVEFKPDEQGACSVINGSTGAEQWIAPGGTLPAGGSLTPAQTQYGPTTAFDRLLIPNGILTGSKNLAGGVNSLNANFRAAAERMVMTTNRGIFRKSSYTTVNGVAGSATTTDVKDVSWCQPGTVYQVRHPTTNTLLDTFTLTRFTALADATGDYVLTFPAAAVGWASGSIIYAVGAQALSMDSLEEVTNAAVTTFQNVTTAAIPAWTGITDSAGGALTSAKMVSVGNAIENFSRSRYHYIAMNPITESNYEELFTAQRRYQTGDKLDQFVLTPSFNGRPIFSGPEISLEDVWFVNKDHISVHEYKKMGPNTDGGENKGGEVNALGLTQHPTANSLEMRISRELQLRVRSRCSSGRITGVTI